MAIELNSPWSVNEMIARLYTYYGSNVISFAEMCGTESDNQIIYFESSINNQDETNALNFCVYDNYNEKKIYISLIDNMTPRSITPHQDNASTDSFIYLSTPTSISNSEILHGITIIDSTIQSTLQSTSQSEINSVDSIFQTPHSTPKGVFSGQETPPVISTQTYVGFNIDDLIYRLQLHKNIMDSDCGALDYKQGTVHSVNEFNALNAIKYYLNNVMSSVKPTPFTIYKKIINNKYIITDTYPVGLHKCTLFNCILIKYTWSHKHTSLTPATSHHLINLSPMQYLYPLCTKKTNSS